MRLRRADPVCTQRRPICHISEAMSPQDPRTLHALYLDNSPPLRTLPPRREDSHTRCGTGLPTASIARRTGTRTSSTAPTAKKTSSEMIATR